MWTKAEYSLVCSGLVGDRLFIWWLEDFYAGLTM